jgi:hypothetical protein
MNSVPPEVLKILQILMQSCKWMFPEIDSKGLYTSASYCTSS